MSTPSLSVSAAPAPAPAAIDELQRHLGVLYALSQSSPYVFASPLGPFQTGPRQAFLPRFLFFGPHASDASWRLCVLAGFDPRDLRAAQAAVELVELLAAEAEAAHGLHVTFFPVVDTAALGGGAADRRLGEAHWAQARPGAPEIKLLEKDARARNYHGFIGVETAPAEETSAVISIRGSVAEMLLPDLARVTAAEIGAIPFRVEPALLGNNERSGPLSIAEDLPFAPFELTLRIPGAWPEAKYKRGAVLLLRQFLWQYRAFQSYGQHL